MRSIERAAENAPLGKNTNAWEIAFSLAAQPLIASKENACWYGELASDAYQDKETGLHQNYFRDYSPSVGRYVQSDPLGIVAGLNTYAYVNGNPLSFTDPLGLDAISGYPMVNSYLNPPKPPDRCYPDDDCKNPVTINYDGVCRADDVLCGQAMKAAGIMGRYYPETKTYSLDCLIKFGIGVKATASVGTTVGLNRAAAAGIRGAATAAAVANNPVTMAASAAYAADAVFQQCECKGR